MERRTKTLALPRARLPKDAPVSTVAPAFILESAQNKLQGLLLFRGFFKRWSGQFRLRPTATPMGNARTSRRSRSLMCLGGGFLPGSAGSPCAPTHRRLGEANLISGPPKQPKSCRSSITIEAPEERFRGMDVAVRMTGDDLFRGKVSFQSRLCVFVPLLLAPRSVQLYAARPSCAEPPRGGESCRYLPAFHAERWETGPRPPSDQLPA
jgi:hypothetical protein